MCISRHGALVSFAYLLRFFQFPCDMHVSNPRQILWTVCVENVKPLSYLASSFGHNFWKYTAKQLYVSLLGPYEWQQPLGIVFLVCITRENLRVRLSIGRREAGVFKIFHSGEKRFVFGDRFHGVHVDQTEEKMSVFNKNWYARRAWGRASVFIEKKRMLAAPASSRSLAHFLLGELGIFLNRLLHWLKPLYACS